MITEGTKPVSSL